MIARMCTTHSRLNVYHLMSVAQCFQIKNWRQKHEEETYESHTGHHPTITTGRERTAYRPGYDNFTSDRSQVSRDRKTNRFLGNLDALLNDVKLDEALGPGVQVPKQSLTVEPYREAIQNWTKQGDEVAGSSPTRSIL